jgi:hypothetical protein
MKPSTETLIKISLAVLAYYEYERKNIPLVIIFVGLMVLFQPLAGIPPGRQMWNFFDVVVAVGLLIMVFIRPAKN